jgi:hypothetical protein
MSSPELPAELKSCGMSTIVREGKVDGHSSLDQPDSLRQ